MKRLTTVTAMSCAAMLAAGFTAAVSDVRIETRVDARIRSSVAAIADSLQREGVTAELMIQSALEGTMKKADPQVILNVVRKWAVDLRRSRQLLGPNAKDDEISAGAQAIRAVLLASATVTRRMGRRSSSACAHMAEGVVAIPPRASRITAVAPTTSSRRR